MFDGTNYTSQYDGPQATVHQFTKLLLNYGFNLIFNVALIFKIKYFKIL